MYVSVTKNQNGIAYVRICESYRDENGKVCHRTIKKFGRLDKQLEQNPNFLEEIKARYEDERNARLKAATSLHLKEAADLLSNSESKDGDDRPLPLLYYGHMILWKLWKDVLGLDTHLAYVQRAKSSIHYDLNRAASYLTFMKVLDPRSVLHSHNDRNDFLGNPAREISLDDCYDCYARLKEYKAGIIRHLNRRLDTIYGKERATLVFYDVTNAYFEAPMTDKEMGLRTDDFIERLAEFAEECRNREVNPLGDECFTSSGELIIKNLPEWFLQEAADEKFEFLRMRGPSKEHRSDLPIVSLALVIDQKGIPMDYEVYAGNASEFKTMSKSIERLKSTYGIKNAIVVADRGLNSVDNLEMLLGNDLGFLVAQKVTNLGAATEMLLNLDEYVPISKEHPELGKYRTVPNWTKTGKGGKKVQCTLVLTWNESRKKRDDVLLDLAIETVKKKMEAGVKIGPRKTGWAQFAQTEEDKKEQKIIGVDEAAVAQRRRFCGFAAMVYSDYPENEESTASPSGAEIAGTYHRLNRIESCFRAMKSNLGLRPMYVRTSDHIQGHIMVCFLALVILRVLQDRLDAKGRHMSIEGLCATLNDARMLAWKLGKDVFFFPVRSHSSECGRGMTVREFQTRQKQRTLPGTLALADVLHACDLRPVTRFSSMAEAARCLGTRWPKLEDAIPKARLSEL